MAEVVFFKKAHAVRTVLFKLVTQPQVVRWRGKQVTFTAEKGNRYTFDLGKIVVARFLVAVLAHIFSGTEVVLLESFIQYTLAEVESLSMRASSRVVPCKNVHPHRTYFTRKFI